MRSSSFVMSRVEEGIGRMHAACIAYSEALAQAGALAADTGSPVLAIGHAIAFALGRRQQPPCFRRVRRDLCLQRIEAGELALLTDIGMQCDG
jgi:hypothetical protein